MIEKLPQDNQTETGVESKVEQSIEARKESLKTEFLTDFEKALLDEHLTIEQLETLVKRTDSLKLYDDQLIDNSYVTDFEQDPHGSGFPTSRGLRGPIETYKFADIKLGTIMEDVFSPIHRKGLKSDLRRHDDGLRYYSVGITGSDMKGIFQRVLGQTKEFRENDTEQKYDEGVLRSYIARYAPNNFGPFTAAIRFLDGMPPEKLQLSLREFAGGKGGEAIKTTDIQNVVNFLDGLPNQLGRDVEEVPVHVLQDILKNELSKLEAIYAEADAKRGNNYQI